jgi:sterol desaturase/sphingolipid hydroxylase (fatty acid hydroxylase superfamily)
VLSWDSFIAWGLLAWFAALAIAEALLEKRELRAASSDGRLLTNFGLAALTITASGLLPLANIGSSLAAQGLGLGVARSLPWVAVFALTLVAQTLASYWLHRLMHRTPLLWRVHRVHHADGLVDVSTSFRNHPFELLLTIPVAALIILIIGAPVSVVLATETFLFAAALWEHADIRLPHRIDRTLSLVLVTPRLHRLHHNPGRALHDSNYCNSIIIWDRLFGTLSDKPDRLPVGLEGQVDRPDHFLEQILSPLHAA